MCNLYSITTNQAAIIALFRVINRYVGNLPPMPGVFPDARKEKQRAAVSIRRSCSLAQDSGSRASTTCANAVTTYCECWSQVARRFSVAA
jgi:hypothetical protein